MAALADRVQSAVMRSKLGTVVLVVAVAFLVATHPVVADAARQITGKQIKNGSVTGKDVKDRSLSAKDLKRGTVPVEVVDVRRFAGGSAEPGRDPRDHRQRVLRPDEHGQGRRLRHRGRQCLRAGDRRRRR